MTLYGLKEMAAFAVGVWLLVEWFGMPIAWAAALAVVVYVWLSVASFVAFRNAMLLGHLRHMQSLSGSHLTFVTSPNCPRRWLVRRYVLHRFQ